MLYRSYRMTTRYELQARLGSGGAGAVYRAWDTRLERAVAIKKLVLPDTDMPTDTSTHGGPDGLRHEALLLSGLQHPNIVTVHDIELEAAADGPFVVMELLEGDTLEEVVRRAPLPLKEFGTLVHDTLNGLAAAHARGILHRDLKPGNLMLIWLPTGEMQFKLLDFGIAKLCMAPSRQTMDQTGGIMGSIHFMAPEQFERVALDARTDLYALGCVYYFALTGRYPFTGETMAQVMAAHLHHHHGSLERLRPDLPAAVVQWVMALMSRLPVERPASTAVALAAYEAALADTTVTQSVPAHQPRPLNTLRVLLPAPPPPPAPAGGSLWFYLTGAALLLALGFAFYPSLVSPSGAAQPVPASGAVAAAPTAAAVKKAVSPAPAADPSLEPTDLDGFRARLDQQVDITGTISHLGESKTGRTRYLNFSRRPGTTISLAFRLPQTEEVFPREKLQALEGQRVRARGLAAEFRGDLLLYIEKEADLQVLP